MYILHTPKIPAITSLQLLLFLKALLKGKCSACVKVVNINNMARKPTFLKVAITSTKSLQLNVSLELTFLQVLSNTTVRLLSGLLRIWIWKAKCFITFLSINCFEYLRALYFFISSKLQWTVLLQCSPVSVLFHLLEEFLKIYRDYFCKYYLLTSKIREKSNSINPYCARLTTLHNRECKPLK